MLASLDKAVKAKSRKAQRALTTSGLELVDALKRAVSVNRSQYRKYTRRSVTHWSSRPGAYPNSDTGFLGMSIQLSNKKKAGSVFVIIGARYARALEFGNSKRGLAARPFIQPTRDAKQRRFQLRILRAMKNA